MSHRQMVMTNEQVYKDFIVEQNAKALSVDWVLWMLDGLADANKRGVQVNPDWLRAEGRLMTARGIEDNEPRMIYE